MRTLILLIYTLVGLAWTCLGLTQESQEPPVFQKAALTLGVGEQRLIRVQGLKKYSLGSDSIRAISRPELGKDALLIKAVKPGTSDLWIWKKDGETEFRPVEVQKYSSQPLSSRLEKALNQLQEVEVLISGQGVVLRGTILSKKEASTVAALNQGFGKEVRDETELSDSLVEHFQKSLQQVIRKIPQAKQLRVERMGSSLWVRGNLSRALDREAIERQLKAQFAKVELDLDALPDDAQTVYFRVFLLEVHKSKFGSLGIGWPSSQAGAFQVTSWGIKEALKLDLKIQALEGEGSAKILSNPELVVRAPGEAELFAGGELPIKTHTHYSSQLNWKNFGLTLKLHVTHAAGDRVRLEIQTEVSHLDPDIETEDKLPGIQSNRLKTQVDARFGVPLLLSGLLQQGVREKARGLPILRQIPILGSLFGSEDYLNERSELVAILLPHSAPPPPPMNQVDRTWPKGPIPPSRNWLDPDRERAMRESPDYPWNALQ